MLTVVLWATSVLRLMTMAVIRWKQFLFTRLLLQCSMTLTRNRTDGLNEQIISEEELENWIVSWILYGIEGIIMTITNFPIVLVVLFFAKLRQQKEFLIIAALAFADGVAGFAFLVAAVGRLIMVSKGTGKALSSSFHFY
uniref:G-protein coupled receptors family 1 profile domain-containing protein n=1 Tax=Plectus sambesii TaxID=2011161 RepID=A0A914XC58_9BILA